MTNSISTELKPTDTLEIKLSNGLSVNLPVAHPTFKLWDKPFEGFSYGNKPILNHKNEPCFAELVILRILLEQGWNGVWVETYGGTHYLKSMPKEWNLQSENIQIPKDKEDLLKRIWKTAKTTSCFDVFAWFEDNVILLEAKRTGKDKLTSAQIRFIEGAIECGIKPESLIIVEWGEKV